MKIITFFLRWVERKICPFTAPTQEELIEKMVRNCAGLGLHKNEFIELAPLPGVCGPFRLSGNTRPVIEYRVFEKKIMEFVHVRVEISQTKEKARMEVVSCIDSTTAPERHGEIIPLKPAYQEPIDTLLVNLYRYFPYYLKTRCVEIDAGRADKTKLLEAKS